MSLVIPVGYGVAAFVLTGAVGTQPYVTTMGLDLSEAGGDFTTVANQTFDAYKNTILPETSNQLTLDRVTLSVGQDGPGGSVDSDTAPSPGTQTGTYPPTAQSCIARKVTNALGREGRGRMFLPGVLREEHVDQDGTVVAARRTQINTALGLFLDDLNGVGTSPLGSIPVPPMLLHSRSTLAPTPITGMVCSDLVGWIRGRIR